MYNPNIRDHAALIGFTRLVMLCSDTGEDLEVYIHPDTDLDTRFPAICAHEGDKLKVNGWMILSVDDIEPATAQAA